MRPATVLKSAAAQGTPALRLALVLGLSSAALVLFAALLLPGCGGPEATTTTSTAIEGTTTTETADTSSSTTEQITTTTTSSFPPTVSHEQDQPRFTFAGKWNTLSAASASGKTLAVANAANCSVTVRFYGVGVSWVAKKSPAYGIAEVTLDGGAPQTVDLYSASTGWKKKVWKSGGLELGDHTLTIAWTGDKNKDAKGTNINVDSIVVAGVLTGNIEQDNAKLSFKGTWKTIKNSSASGGGFKQADASGASVTIRFTGVRLVWFGRIGPGYGQAKVRVDGGPESTVDLYSSSAKSKQEIWDSGVLSFKTHTITISWSGEKHANSSGSTINVDRFDVTGSLK